MFGYVLVSDVMFGALGGADGEGMVLILSAHILYTHVHYFEILSLHADAYN